MIKNMERKYILDQINNVFSNKGFCITESQCNEEFEKLGVDSLNLISCILKLEENLGIEIEDEYLTYEQLGSVERLVNYFTHRLE